MLAPGNVRIIKLFNTPRINSMEIVRRSLRRLISTNSWFYRLCASTLDLGFITARYGPGAYLRLIKAQRPVNRDQAPLTMSFNNLLHPINIRPGTDDARTIIDNIIREEWGKFEPDSDPRLMIDGGAYIGDSSAYFLSRFPTLNVIALEPDEITFQAMKKNLAPYGGRVKTVNAGLYSHEGTVRFQQGQTAASIQSGGDCEISVTTIKALLEEHSHRRIDILKLDIEGAEESVFSTRPEEWLNHVDWLIIEFHSDEGEATISRILKDNGFTMRQYRSVWYCRNLKGAQNGHA